MAHEEKVLKQVKPYIQALKETESFKPVLSYYLELYVC